MTWLSNWRILGRLAALLLMVLVLACGPGVASYTDQSVPPAAVPGSLQVLNTGSLTIANLYVTPTWSSNWGGDQLAPYAIYPGDSYTLSSLPEDTYDVQAVFVDGSVDTVFDVPIQAGVTTPLTLMNTGLGSLAVANASGFTINTIYITPSSSSTWGPNQLDLPLNTGQIQTFTGMELDTYDMRVVFSNGSYLDFTGLSVTSGTVTDVQVN